MQALRLGAFHAGRENHHYFFHAGAVHAQNAERVALNLDFGARRRARQYPRFERDGTRSPRFGSVPPIVSRASTVGFSESAPANVCRGQFSPSFTVQTIIHERKHILRYLFCFSLKSFETYRLYPLNAIKSILRNSLNDFCNISRFHSEFFFANLCKNIRPIKRFIQAYTVNINNILR